MSDDARPWTTMRCNRLLRPITTQIAALRTALYGKQNGGALTSDCASLSAAAERSSDDSRDNDEDDEDGEKGVHDPDWVPQGAKKIGLKRRYGSRPARTAAKAHRSNRRDRGEPLRPGEISMPTPLIARRAQLSDSIPWRSPQRVHGNQFNTPPKKRRIPMLKHLQLANLRTETTADLLQHVERLLEAFSHLLQSTTEKPVAERSGTRSMMSTCLRQIPAYIEGRQEWEDEESDIKVDVSSDVYEELERTGTGSGWGPLREVVRAHAVTLVTDAILDKLLDVGHIRALIRLCDKFEAYDDAEEFLSAFLFAAGRLPIPSSERIELLQYTDATYPAISAVHSWTERNCRWPFFYRQLRGMLLCGLLPIEWLATLSLKPILTRVIRSASEAADPAHAEAGKLLQTVILLACGTNPAEIYDQMMDQDENVERATTVAPRVRLALNNTISSLSTVLASIVLVSDNDTGSTPTGAHAVHCALEITTTDLVNKVLSGHLGDMVSRCNLAIERMTGPLTCAMILAACGKRLTPNFAQLDPTEYIKALKHAEDLERQSLLNLPGTVCLLAKGCGKARMDDGFGDLQMIVRSLRSFNPAADENLAPTDAYWERVGFPTWFMKRLALDSSMEFAERSMSTAHHAFAQSIEEEMHSGNTTFPDVPTPFRRAYVGVDTMSHPSAFFETAGGYRWEAGISEWVAVTPYERHPSRQKKRAVPPPASPSPPTRPGSAADIMAGGGFDALPSSPIKANIPTGSRPTLSQLFLSSATPETLAATSSFPQAQPSNRDNTAGGTTPTRKRQRTEDPGPFLRSRLSTIAPTSNSSSASSSYNEGNPHDSGLGTDHDSRTEQCSMDDDEDDDDQSEEDELAFSLVSPVPKHPRLRLRKIGSLPPATNAAPAVPLLRPSSGRPSRKSSVSLASSSSSSSGVGASASVRTEGASRMGRGRPRKESASGDRRLKRTSSVAFGLDGVGDSEDELSFV